MSVDSVQVAAHHANAGSQLMLEGRLPEAVAALQRAVHACPGMPELHYNLGNAHWRSGAFVEAEECFRRALGLRPSLVEAHNNLAALMLDRSRPASALKYAEQALALRPSHAEARVNRALALLAVDPDRLSEARRDLECAVVLRPAWAAAHVNLGSVMHAQGDLVDAVRTFEHALELDSGLAEAHTALANTLLMVGEYARGWTEYEWRWQQKSFPSKARHQNSPAWAGEPLAGRRLHVWSEQGLGDTLQFVRLVRLLADGGANVSLEVQPELSRLVAESFPDVRVVSNGESAPAFDVHAPLMSLPHLLGARMDASPSVMPYLSVAAGRSASWSTRLGQRRAQRRIGLAWAGNRQTTNLSRRSVAAELLAPLVSVRDVEWISLQKGSAGQPPLQLRDWTAELTDLAETAALIAQLDLVITVDTAIAHLAGALGVPVWIMLLHVPDWRWQLQRSDSPWYPTARLFRQRISGVWDDVVDALARELSR